MNSHARTISLEFANQGFFVFHHTAVGDNMERIRNVFSLAQSRANVVVVTGGLGPTDDDLTREALAAFLNRPLELSEPALRHLEDFFAKRNVLMPAANRKQAYCIKGGELIDNPNGTAPGVYVEAGGVHYFLLPGPPLEMQPMLAGFVIPKLRKLFRQTGVLRSRVLHFCGIGESAVDERIKDLTSMSNPTVAPLAGEGEMLLRITATAETEEEADAKIAPVEEELRSRFPRYIYGVDDETLPIALGKALLETNSTLAIAESCTGGQLSSLVTNVPGASKYVYGSIVAYHDSVKRNVLKVNANTIQTYGAVSEETAREMATQVRQLFGSTYGLAATGIAGPSGGTQEKPVGLVYGAVATPSETITFRMQMSGSREQYRLRTSKQLMYRLWLTLRGHQIGRGR